MIPPSRPRPIQNAAGDMQTFLNNALSPGDELAQAYAAQQAADRAAIQQRMTPASRPDRAERMRLMQERVAANPRSPEPHTYNPELDVLHSRAMSQGLGDRQVASAIGRDAPVPIRVADEYDYAALEADDPTVSYQQLSSLDPEWESPALPLLEDHLADIPVWNPAGDPPGSLPHQDVRRPIPVPPAMTTPLGMTPTERLMKQGQQLWSGVESRFPSPRMARIAVPTAAVVGAGGMGTGIYLATRPEERETIYFDRRGDGPIRQY